MFMNPQEAQAVFLQEVQLGEELLAEGFLKVFKFLNFFHLHDF